MGNRRQYILLYGEGPGACAPGPSLFHLGLIVISNILGDERL